MEETLGELRIALNLNTEWVHSTPDWIGKKTHGSAYHSKILEFYVNIQSCKLLHREWLTEGKNQTGFELTGNTGSRRQGCKTHR